MWHFVLNLKLLIMKRFWWINQKMFFTFREPSDTSSKLLMQEIQMPWPTWERYTVMQLISDIVISMYTML